MVHRRQSVWKVLTRRKHLAADGTEGESKLNRVLGLWDLTALGVGSTLGAGVYVLAGQIAKEQAGPSVMISFAIAALASLLAGICYAEFGARVPKAGSAYVYSYVCIGEFAAFVIGWNLILEYVIGTASVCRGISLYLDSLLNDTLKETFNEIAPMNVSFLGSYFDFFAFGLVVVFGVALAFGVETSAMANNFVTCVNIFILLFVIIGGAIKADFSNWTIDVSTVNDTNIGTGGYFPFGFAGTLKGAATCFFGFVGFDCIATTGEEVRNPRKNIPRSILLSLLIIFLCYFGVSTVLTLMLPYYQQDANAPLPYAFESVGWPVAMWIVTIGGLIGLLASLFGALFPLPRVMYSMAQDGLLFRFLGKISNRFQVPVIGSIAAAIFTALIAGLFDLAQLVSLLSIGTLLAYSVVAISITILRYMEYQNEQGETQMNGGGGGGGGANGRAAMAMETTSLNSSTERLTLGSVCSQLFNVHRYSQPNVTSTRIVGVLTTLFCILCLGLGLLIMHGYSAICSQQPWALSLLIVFLVLMAIVLLLTCLQPREPDSPLFRVPFVPIVPAVSIFINIYLMLQLDSMTWIRFGVWMLLGLPIFIACWCLYDIKNPQQRNTERVEFLKLLKEKQQQPLVDKCNGCTSIESITTTASTQATHEQMKSKVNSLDQIQTLSEVSDDLIEIKHANGKLFYVEDTKSNHSSAKEDEHSVIALLDDVLNAEDAQQQQQFNPNEYNIFGRHFSMDSEMYPSVIETTIRATVHTSSSSSGSGSGSDDDVDSMEMQRYYEECKVAANEMLQILFESAEFHDQLQQQQQLQVAAKRNSPNSPNSTNIITYNRANSVASVESIDDPLHSEKFKNRLSHIIMKGNSNNIHNHHNSSKTLLTKREDDKLTTTTSPSESPPMMVRPSAHQLKQSKSETDVRQLMLRALSELKRPTDNDDDDEQEEHQNSTSATTTTNGIPRAPKFDPVLYKTINSISLHKQRPSLTKEPQPTPSASTTTMTTPLQTNPMANGGEEEHESATSDQLALPFKAKLEAILKRGPSHRTQQRPEVQQRHRHHPRPQSAFIADNDDDKGNGNDNANDDDENA